MTCLPSAIASTNTHQTAQQTPPQNSNLQTTSRQSFTPTTASTLPPLRSLHLSFRCPTLFSSHHCSAQLMTQVVQRRRGGVVRSFMFVWVNIICTTRRDGAKTRAPRWAEWIKQGQQTQESLIANSSWRSLFIRASAEGAPWLCHSSFAAKSDSLTAPYVCTRGEGYTAE